MTAPPPDEPPREPDSESPEEVPELDPEFADALREAGGKPGEGEEDETPAEAGEQAAEPEAEADEPEAEADEPSRRTSRSGGAAPEEEDSRGRGARGRSRAGAGGGIDDSGHGRILDRARQRRQARAHGCDRRRGSRGQRGGYGGEEDRSALVAAAPAAVGRPGAAPEAQALLAARPARLVPDRLLIRSATAVAGILLELSDIVEDIQPIAGGCRPARRGRRRGGRRTSSSSAPTSASATPARRNAGCSDTTILLRARPRPERDRAAEHPPRPQGRDPRLRDRQVQRRLCARRPEADPADGQAADRGWPAINHVVNVDFLGFVRAINAIELRLHRRRPPLLPLQRRRAGRAAVRRDQHPARATSGSAASDALDYVRYRHTDTDLVRAARQQDFLREARQRVPVRRRCSATSDELIEIFTDYTSSDISDAEDDARGAASC